VTSGRQARLRPSARRVAVETRPPPRTAPNPPPGPRLCALLVSDLENFTGVVHRLGDGLASHWIRCHDAILRDSIRTHGGREVAHTGDGMIACFPLASSALEAAQGIVRAMASGSSRELRAPLRARIGLHAGEPLHVDGRLFGSCVNTSVRTCERAAPGQVLVTNLIKQLVTGQHFDFDDYGPLRLTGIETDLTLYALRCNPIAPQRPEELARIYSQPVSTTPKRISANTRIMFSQSASGTE
jgi:adenylate cyclase